MTSAKSVLWRALVAAVVAGGACRALMALLARALGFETHPAVTGAIAGAAAATASRIAVRRTPDGES